jgi:hypothetical protein
MLEAGAGNSMMTWRHVQAETGSVIWACAYDRAGVGFSDATRACLTGASIQRSVIVPKSLGSAGTPEGSVQPDDQANFSAALSRSSTHCFADERPKRVGCGSSGDNHRRK